MPSPRIAECTLDATSEGDDMETLSVMCRSSPSITSPTPPQRPPPPPPAHAKHMSDVSLISINDDDVRWGSMRATVVAVGVVDVGALADRGASSSAADLVGGVGRPTHSARQAPIQQCHQAMNAPL